MSQPLQGADAEERFGTRWRGYECDEVMVPMRDGARLHTYVFRPKVIRDPVPIILTRSPYGWVRPDDDPYYTGEIHGEWCIHSCMINEGYIFIAQDERGRWGSEGTFELLRPFYSEQDPEAVDDITDTHDTIDWALKTLSGHNGRVGLNGNSYRGWHVMAGLVRPHPAVKAAVPSAACSEGFIGDDFFHNGAFALAQALLFFTRHIDLYPYEAAGQNLFSAEYDGLDLYDAFLDAGTIEDLRAHFPDPSPVTDAVLAHDRFDDFWASREVKRALHRVPTVPTLFVNNWYDAEDQYGTLTYYQEMAQRDPADHIHLISGPWAHGGWRFGAGDRYGPFSFGSDTARSFRDDILGPFLRHHLKGEEKPVLPRAHLFDCAARCWRSFSAWPPEGAAELKLYLHAGEALTWSCEDGPPCSIAFTADPHDPVPFMPRPNSAGWTDGYRTYDQRFSADRADVLVFESEPLNEDLTLSGAVVAHLFASSEGTDTDFVVKLIDAYPEEDPDASLAAYHRLVLGDIFRAKFRESFTEPTPLIPGQVEHYRIPLLERLYTFKAGHRIVVHIQGSWFPLFDRNPNVFGHIPSLPLDRYTAVENRIFMGRAHPSHIALQVMAERSEPSIK